MKHFFLSFINPDRILISVLLFSSDSVDASKMDQTSLYNY